MITPLTLIYLLIMPGFLAFVLYRNRATLHTPEIKQSIGSLYLNYETDKNSVFHFTMWFLYRRLAFAFTLAFCKVSVVLQVQISIYMSLALLAYILKWQPMEADQYDFLAIFNEAVLLFCCYLLLLYTDYVGSPELRYEFGKIFLYTLYFNFALNLLLLANEIFRVVKLECKKKAYHRKVKKREEAEGEGRGKEKAGERR